MYDADALEAINGDQLVTATDRLLLRGGQLSKRRHLRRLAEGSQPHIVVARLAEGSQPAIPVGFAAERTEDGTRLCFAAQRTEEAPRPCFSLDSTEPSAPPYPTETRFADGSEPHVSIRGVGDRTQPDLALACAWDTTIPHPVPPAAVAQPYLGSIVAAPFTSAPHPAPPVRDSNEYLAAPACALVIAAARHARTSPVIGVDVGVDVDIDIELELELELEAPAASCSSSRTASHGSLAFIAAAPFASDCYPALHGRASQSRLDDITGPLPAGFDPAAAHASQHLVLNAFAPRGPGAPQGEPTAVIRRPSARGMQVFALTVVIPALVGVAVGLAALL